MMKKKAFIFLAVAAMMLLTACCDDKQELQPNQYGGKPVGYLTPLLLWEDEADAGMPIDDIRFTVSGTGGTTVTQRFDNTGTAADWLQQLPVGDYDVLVTVDMDEAHGYVLENAATRGTTRADEATVTTALPDTRVSLADPSSSPRQSWYAVTHATVREDFLTVSLGALAADPADAATLRHDDHTLMPTAGGQERCYLSLNVTTPDGTSLTYLADAPRMECGKAYVVELDYTKLRPYMLLSAFTINDWTEGWTISGEILNPTNK